MFLRFLRIAEIPDDEMQNLGRDYALGEDWELLHTQTGISVNGSDIYATEPLSLVYFGYYPG